MGIRAQRQTPEMTLCISDSLHTSVFVNGTKTKSEAGQKNKSLLVLFCNQKDREDPRQSIRDRQRLQERVTVGGLKLGW